MKKVKAICIFKRIDDKYIIVDFTVQIKRDLVCLCHNYDESIAYKYVNFKDLYASLLNLLKSNNFYVEKWNEYDTVWYDIAFIDESNDCNLCSFPKLFE